MRGWLWIAMIPTLGCVDLSGLSEFTIGDQAGVGGATSTSSTGGSGGSGGSGDMTGGGGGDGGAESLGPFRDVRLVAEVSLDTADEDDPTFTADSLELYYNREESIWLSTRTSANSPWGPGERVAELSSGWVETNGIVSQDGLSFWLARDRNDGLGLEIFVSTRANRDNLWSPPEHVPELGSPEGDTPTGISGDGLTMFLQSRRNSGEWKIFMSQRKSLNESWGAPAFQDLNDAGSNRDAWINPDGLQVFWTRESAIYSASRPTASDSFTDIAAHSELNSVTATDPWLLPDLRYIMFVRGSFANRDIFEAWR